MINVGIAGHYRVVRERGWRFFAVVDRAECVHRIFPFVTGEEKAKAEKDAAQVAIELEVQNRRESAAREQRKQEIEKAVKAAEEAKEAATKQAATKRKKK